MAAYSKVLGLIAVSRAKTAETGEMQLGILSRRWLDPGNTVLDGRADAPTQKALLRLSDRFENIAKHKTFGAV